MYLREFDRNGYAQISISEDEINALSNALFEYCQTKQKDKRIYKVRKQLYIIYEILHHGACFDDDTLRIIQKMQEDCEENK